MNIERIDFKISNLRLPIIIIIGPPGAGKTEVGKRLAATLHWDFYDTDVLIENATKMEISEIFSQHTEAVFRQLENALTKSISERCKNIENTTQKFGGTILSCGGGLPVSDENFDNLRQSGTIICLQASVPTLMARVTQVKHRPLLYNDSLKPDSSSNAEMQARLEKLLASRKAVYAKAEHQIDTSDQSIEEVVASIKKIFKL